MKLKLTIEGKEIGTTEPYTWTSDSKTSHGNNKIPDDWKVKPEDLPDAPQAGQESKTAAPNGFKAVSKSEFDDFIKNHPAKLDYDVTGISDPPMASYNDFSDGKVWPKSVVALIYLNEAHPLYKGHTNEYFIKTL